MPPEQPPTDSAGTPESLNRLERQLYAREVSPELQSRHDELKRLGIRRHQLPAEETNAPTTPTSLTNINRVRTQRRRRLLLIAGIGGLILLVAGGAAAATMWYRIRHNVTEKDIGIALEGPASTTSGAEVAYTVTYTNKSRVDWQRVDVVVELPTGLTVSHSDPPLQTSGRQHILTLDTLPRGTSGTLSIKGRLIGEFNAALITKAEVTMTPVNFPSGRFATSSLFTTTISNVPLELAIEVPPEAQAGERIVGTVTVTNTSAATLSNVYLALRPTEDVELVTSDLQFSPDFSSTSREWLIPEVPSLQTVTRQVVLVLHGTTGEKRLLELEAGLKQNDSRIAQRTVAATIGLASAELAIDQTYNQAESPLTVRAGQPLQGKITFANKGTVALKDVIIRVQLSDPLIDETTLSLTGGSYSAATRTITWTSASVPALSTLQPQATGEITYGFTLKPAAEFPATVEHKNKTLTITASVDSPTTTTKAATESRVYSNQFVISITSDLTLTADAVYDDGRLGLTSTGPLPPRVGQETTYTIRFRLGSTLNDAGDVRLVTVVPDGVRYTGQNYLTTGELTFNERSHELVWVIAQIPGLTGRASPPAELHIQVAITPAPNQAGQAITFLNRLTSSATDLFTDQEITADVAQFPSTSSAVPGKGSVQN